MKRLALLLFLMHGCFGFAQYDDNYYGIGAGLDFRNITIGSVPTNSDPAINFQLQLYYVVDDFEMNAGYESFPRLDYDRFSLGFGYHFPLYMYLFGDEFKTTLIPSLEPSYIGRYRNWGGGISGLKNEQYLTGAFNMALRWDIGSNLSFEYSFNAIARTDLADEFPQAVWYGKAKIGNTPIVGSNFIKIIFRIER